MLFSKQVAPTQSLDASELISVSLKTLIDLARPAAGLKQHYKGIRAQQAGGYVSHFKGRGMEFDEVRPYQPGDDIRRIDWRVTARMDQTYTKIFREERERPVFISVDNRPTMHFATRGVFKSVLAAKLAALLAWTAEHHGDRIGGQIFSLDVCQELKPHNGKHAVLRFLNTLVTKPEMQQQQRSKTPKVSEKPQIAADLVMTLEQVLARLTQHVRPGSLVYIISDFRGVDDKAEAHLAKLRRHCDVVLIFVYDPLESTLPTKGRYRFTDDKRDVVIDTSDSQRLTQYQQNFVQRLQRLEVLAKKMGLVLIQCSTVQNPIQQLR
ncbi:DUF58 domain-containing protein [Crenothrix polyspora]|uniref:DUF58 domain-containing protein n=1 Tax=Crenothrix polyspora TaxID=360316 RepID=A0A1R4HHG8_9GAMM|nr:DUF58 domain-containing protein [Crenothrix polyspora]SJM95682.1 conserved hypothetical protein [Crenothrix polyspora]